MFDLENDLPDELMGTGSWGDQLGSNKPPAQGPGPGAQLNGEDLNVIGGNAAIMQRQPVHLAHQIHMQQQVRVFLEISGKTNSHKIIFSCVL